MSQVEAGGTHVYHTFDGELRRRVGIHDAATLAGRHPYGVFHDLSPMVTVEGVRVSSTSIVFHFTVEGPSHQVIVTDTRTWRTFPFAGLERHPELMDENGVTAQFTTNVPGLGDRLLLVVVTTNCPPIPSVREAAFLGAAGNYWVGKKAGATYYKLKKFLYDNDLNDSWEFPDRSLDRLLVAITNKFPTIDGVLTGQAVFMSGDVHFSFASRLAYWADVQRLGDAPGLPKRVKAVFGQLVASALKNEKGATRGLQKAGYGYTPKEWQQHVTWTHDPTGYVGWNLPPAAPARKVRRLKPGIIRSANTFTVDGDQPTLVAQIVTVNNDITLDVKPDYRYRLDYLPTAVTGQTFDPSSSLGQIWPANRNDAAKSYANASRAHRDLIDSGASLPEVIGFNNISEVTFIWHRADGSPATSVNDAQAITRRVLHTLRWQQPGTSPTPLFATSQRFPHGRLFRVPAHHGGQRAMSLTAFDALVDELTALLAPIGLAVEDTGWRDQLLFALGIVRGESAAPLVGLLAEVVALQKEIQALAGQKTPSFDGVAAVLDSADYAFAALRALDADGAEEVLRGLGEALVQLLVGAHLAARCPLLFRIGVLLTIIEFPPDATPTDEVLVPARRYGPRSRLRGCGPGGSSTCSAIRSRC